MAERGWLREELRKAVEEAERIPGFVEKVRANPSGFVRQQTSPLPARARSTDEPGEET